MRSRGWAALFALAILVAGCRGGAAPVSGEARDDPPPPATDTSPRVVCPLCGEPATEALVSRRILAVLLDNHPAARPQAGLAQACLVYEVPVEGGVTRFVAFYLHREAPVLLPIRSARTYFLDWVAELDAALAHCGGTLDSLADITRLKIASLDEIKKAQAYYERHTGRKAPHNLRSSTDRLRRAVAALGYEYDPARVPAGLFRFDDEPGWQGDPANSLRLSYGTSSGPGAVEWRYDAASGQYLRFQDGKAHTSATDTREQVRAGTVIVLPVRVTPIQGSLEGYLTVQLTGSGKATVLARGMATEARWSKPDRSRLTVYTLANGLPLGLPPGPVWIQVIPLNTKVEVKE